MGNTNRAVDIIRCENYGEISATGTGNAIIGVKLGGIVGRADGESYYLGRIIGCVNYGTVHNAHPQHGYTGGIVGHNGSTVTYCVNMGNVHGNSLTYGIGTNDGNLFACLNAGTVSGENSITILEEEGLSVSAGDASLTDGSLVSRLNALADG